MGGRRNYLVKPLTLNGYSASFSTQSLIDKGEMTDEQFYQWLAGFADAECNFYVGISPLNNKIIFRFKIGLHIDDREALDFIRDKLGFGHIYLKSNNSVDFIIHRNADIANIIKIFQKYPIQSTKWLNFIDFAECFELFSSKSDDFKNKTLNIKKQMNNSRTNFKLPITKKIQISAYWFLGFIEGEGSFTPQSLININYSFL